MNPSQGPKLDERRLLALAAARLSSEGQTQVEIAHELSISQPEVSRLLGEAKQHWHFDPHPTLQRRYVDDVEWDEVERRHFIDQPLVTKLRNLPPREVERFDVRICPGGLDEFAYRAAGRVADLVRQARTIGVMWGRTLLATIDAMASRWRLTKGAKPPLMDCVPLCGDPVFLMNQKVMERSASQLAATLEIALTGSRNPALPCLIGVPAYIPMAISHGGGTARSDLADFLERIPGYQAIFKRGKGTAWVDRVDTILTGVGVVGDPGQVGREEGADFIRERMLQENLSERELAQLVYGDIGGVLLERQGLSPVLTKLLEKLNRGWTGIRKEHLRQVAEKAKPDGRPGVILVAAGEAKAEVVRLVIKNGYVNELIIDFALAQGLRNLCL